MQLEQLLLHISYESVQGSPKQEITDICYHSEKVRCGSLFVCLRGFRTDGAKYLPDAIARGAVAVVAEEGTRLSDVSEVTVVRVRDARYALAVLSAAFFDFPAGKLTMVGITGTKGKTTTAYLTAQVLREAGYRVGLIGTVAIDDGAEVIEADHTTPESYEVQRYLAAMVEHGCDCCVMEVSSQGLKMQRVAGIYFDIGVFLNIEPDHIGAGEHESFEEYLLCKSKLLQQCDIGIVNYKDRHREEILKEHTCELEFFLDEQERGCRARNLSCAMRDGKLFSEFDLYIEERRLPVRLQLPGSFNVNNAVAVAAIVKHFDVTDDVFLRTMEQARVPGRCENVSPSDKYVLLIDYAHNEMSIKNLLENLRMFESRRIVILFGCGGNRSKLRRSGMGWTAGQLADFTILTSDNPRWEDAEAILDDIEKGMLAVGGDYVRITDRREAIAYALFQARQGDIIVLAGKGHEAYQEICGVKYPMQDKEIVKKLLKEKR